MLFLRVRDSKAVAQVDGLFSPSGLQLLLSRQHWSSPPLFESGAHGVDLSHKSHPTRPPSFADVTATRHLRCLEPAAEIRRDQPLPPGNSSTTASFQRCCPTRGKVSRVAWQPSKWGTPFRESEVGSAARAVELYTKWLFTRKDLLSQLPSSDGKRLLCHCKSNSPCHVGALIATWQSHRWPLGCGRCVKCASTTLTCSRCVTGSQDNMRAWSSREKGTIASRSHLLQARKWYELYKQRPWATKLMALME